MTEKEKIRISKFLSLVLRHQPETIGVRLDENGWTDMDMLIDRCSAKGHDLTFPMLLEIVETNPKKRFAFNEDLSKIRASQGHSVAVDLGYVPSRPPEVLYHGTGEKNLVSILENGIEKRNRHHVHLSASKETALAVGSRHGKPVVLEVLSGKMYADGISFFLSENNV